jgi:hypothetical protein
MVSFRQSNINMEMIEFASKELYFLIAFLCGLYLGYLIGRRDAE